MKVSVFGTGYVGLVHGLTLCEVGHEVICVDIDADKIAALNQLVSPIHEPGLEALLNKHQPNGRIQFTTNLDTAVNESDILFIAVGTPPNEDGSADLQHVLDVASNIAKSMTGPKLIINKSTVPVGTADKVESQIQSVLSTRKENISFAVVSNPEFLKEGAAIADSMKPDRIIIGADNEEAVNTMRQLYAPFSRNHDKIIVMDRKSAELTKYAANCMLATKISFMNEMANLADALGCDIEKVRIGIGSDPRIGYHFIYPGCGYGGSCFPKDVKALVNTAEQENQAVSLLKSVEAVNESQKTLLGRKINNYFKGKLKGKVVAIWGLAFKPNTDDMREAPSLALIKTLLAAGMVVQAFDPESMQEAQKCFHRDDAIALAGTKEAALKGADFLVICTEWQDFRAPDFDLVKESLKAPVIFDGRNMYDPNLMRELGFDYIGIGRHNLE